MSTINPGGTEHRETIVIGGGQAGLSVGYYLSQRGSDFVILDAGSRVGDSWRNRWDSLLLFTPARLDGLPGMRFPAKGDRFIGKDDMADYLEGYARRFELPVHNDSRVERLARTSEGRFSVSTSARDYVADNVIVAMANSQVPWVPSFADQLSPDVFQMHSKDYRRPDQLRDGPVLIVGAGNSGADLGMELVPGRKTFMSGKESGHVPFRIETFVARHFLLRLVRFAGHRVLSVGTPIGRKLRPKLLAKAPPLVRVKPKDLVAAGVERVPRVVGVKNGYPELEDGRVLEVPNVLWCTGFRPGFSWIDLPILGDRQEPDHEKGVVHNYPGLYFVGLHFLYSMTSETVTGVPRDAKRIVKLATSRSGTRASATAVGAAAAI